MKDTNQCDDWLPLCELASRENDPRKLLDLISKINRALEECRQHTQQEQTLLKVDTALLQRANRTDFDCYRFPSPPSLAIEYDC